MSFLDDITYIGDFKPTHEINISSSVGRIVLRALGPAPVCGVTYGAWASNGGCIHNRHPITQAPP